MVPSGVLEINAKRIGRDSLNTEEEDAGREPRGFYNKLVSGLLHRSDARSARGKSCYTRCRDIELQLMEALAPTFGVAQKLTEHRCPIEECFAISHLLGGHDCHGAPARRPNPLPVDRTYAV